MWLTVSRTVFVRDIDGMLHQKSDEEIAILRGTNPLGVQIAIFEAMIKEDVKAAGIHKAEVTVEELYSESNQHIDPMVKAIQFTSLEEGDDREILYSLSER